MRDFETPKWVARQGVSSLFQAKHKVDQQLYAIRAISLCANTKNGSRLRHELARMLREVRLLAAIQDSNIIRYHHSWIEVEYLVDSEDRKTPNADLDLPPHLIPTEEAKANPKPKASALLLLESPQPPAFGVLQASRQKSADLPPSPESFASPYVSHLSGQDREDRAICADGIVPADIGRFLELHSKDD